MGDSLLWVPDGKYVGGYIGSGYGDAGIDKFWVAFLCSILMELLGL
jgi:hypothetical protein